MKLRKIFYLKDRYVNLNGNTPFKVVKGTLSIELVENNDTIVYFYLLPYSKVYHLLNKEYQRKVIEKFGKGWEDRNIYIFISFTSRKNVIKYNLPFELTNVVNNKRDSLFEDLFSLTYKIGMKNTLKIYKEFYKMSEENNIEIDNIMYMKIHRMTNSRDTVNIISADKFKKRFRK